MTRKTTDIVRAAATTSALLFCLTLSAHAQTTTATSPASSQPPPQRAPSSAARPFLVLPAQKLAEIEGRLRPGNNIEDVIAGEGLQTRFFVQHERDKNNSEAEVHDNADDYHFVLEGAGTYTLGGQLDAPREISPGEWRAARVTGGQKVEVKKGDMIFVPRGTAHVRSTAGRDFSLMLVKVFAAPVPKAPTPKPDAPAKSNTAPAKN